MILNEEFLKKLINRSRYYYKDKDSAEHAEEVYGASVNRERVVRSSEDKQIDLLALCLTSCYKLGTTTPSYFTVLDRLTGITKQQYYALFRNFKDLDQINKIEEDGFVEEKDKKSDLDRDFGMFQDLVEDNEPENDVVDENVKITIDVNNNNVTTTIEQNNQEEINNGYYSTNEHIIDANLINNVYAYSNIDVYTYGEQPQYYSPDLDLTQEIDGLPVHTFLSNKINELNQSDNNPDNTIQDKKQIALGKLEVYGALRQRSEERSWLEVFKHPFNTFKEWLLKKDLGNQLKENYNLTDDSLKEVSDRCLKGVGNFKYLDGNGEICHSQHNQGPEKPKTEYDLVVDKLIDSINNPSKYLDKEELGKQTDLFSNKTISSSINGKENGAIENSMEKK